MNYTTEQIKTGVAAYLDHEFMPQLGEGNTVKKVLFGAAISVAIARYTNLAEAMKQHPFVQALGVVDENGSIDVDTFGAALKQNVPKDGVKVDIPTMGTMTLDGTDVDKLLTYIKQTGGN